MVTLRSNPFTLTVISTILTILIIMQNKYNNTMAYFHLNCRGLSSNWESFYNLICDLHCDTFKFDCIGISELYRCENDKRLTQPGYHKLINRCRSDGPRGRVGLFIMDNIKYMYIIREDLGVFYYICY